MKYEKRITLGYDKFGKRIRKRIQADTKLELSVKESELRREFNDDVNMTSVRFKDYAVKWLNTFKAARSEATKEMYEVALRKTSAIDDMLIREIRSPDIQSIINKNMLHPDSCKKLYMTLKQIFNRAMLDGIIRSNPCQDITLPKKEKKEERSLTDEELSAITQAELTEQQRMFVNLLFYFGLRPQEMLALRTDDFDFEKNTLSVSRAVGYKGNNPYIKPTKTFKARKMPIPKVFVSDAKSYVETIRSQNSAYLMHQNGNLMTKTVKSDMWLKIKAEIEKKLGHKTSLRPYNFRHNFCSECFYRNISILKTAELMATSPEMVMRVYAHLDNERENLDNLTNLELSHKNRTPSGSVVGQQT